MVGPLSPNEDVEPARDRTECDGLTRREALAHIYVESRPEPHALCARLHRDRARARADASASFASDDQAALLQAAFEDFRMAYVRWEAVSAG